MFGVAGILCFLTLCYVVTGINTMADPEVSEFDFLYSDDRCVYHEIEHHKPPRDTTASYKQWNDRVLTYIPCKDCGKMRYHVQVETAPQPTRKSPKPASCVKVK